MILVAIDPGVRGCGVSVFQDSVLHHAGYVTNPVPRGDDLEALRAMGAAVAHVLPGSVSILVVEFPIVYPGAKAKGDPKDLLSLATIDGVLAGMVPARSYKRLFPREWKGQVDKETCHTRIKARLSKDELGTVVLPIASLAHNVWDAVGIGLFAVGRFDRFKVYPGATP